MSRQLRSSANEMISALQCVIDDYDRERARASIDRSDYLRGEMGRLNRIIRDAERAIEDDERERTSTPAELAASYEKPTSCECAATPHPPCSWCTDPERTEEDFSPNP